MVRSRGFPLGCGGSPGIHGSSHHCPGEFSSAPGLALGRVGGGWHCAAISPKIPQPWMAGALYWPCWPGLAGDSIFHCRQKRGKFFRGSDGLAIAMTLGGVVLLPIGILAEGALLCSIPRFLLAGFRGSTVIFGNSLFPGAGSPQDISL